MSVARTPIAQQERIERQARVERAKASVRLEGLAPTVAANSIFDRYASGEIAIEQMGTEIRALNAREFRPTLKARQRQ